MIAPAPIDINPSAVACRVSGEDRVLMNAQCVPRKPLMPSTLARIDAQVWRQKRSRHSSVRQATVNAARRPIW